MSQDSLLEKFRLELLKRGPAGIKSIGCYFRQIDDDGSKSLSLNEFQEGILNHKIDLNKQEINELFRLFDKDCSGKIGYEEFLLAVRVCFYLRLLLFQEKIKNLFPKAPFK